MTAVSTRLATGRLHYAWVIIGLTFVVIVVTAGVRATPCVLIVPLENEFHWSRSTISFAIGINLLPKHLAVLNAAAERAGYGKAPAGTYHGLAQFMGYGSYVAACAEVSVSADGRLKIHRIVAAANPGHVVNPAQIERQVAGSFVYGLSAALYGEITIKDGRVVEDNFDTYNVLRIDEMP